jgi:hypothetical protein
VLPLLLPLPLPLLLLPALVQHRPAVASNSSTDAASLSGVPLSAAAVTALLVLLEAVAAVIGALLMFMCEYVHICVHMGVEHVSSTSGMH